VKLFAQNDSTGNASASNQTNKKKWPGDETALRIFYGQRLINAKTVEVLPKGSMAFTVVHTFGDVAGENGGTYTFLDWMSFGCADRFSNWRRKSPECPSSTYRGQ
jgi:hypothetical protein